MDNKTVSHLEHQTVDGTQLNLDALYQICPSCFTETKGEDGQLKHVINFEKLRALLGDNAVEDAPEVYDFTWVGKRAALREAMAPCRKTLRPCPEESVDWDTTKNLYIEGDNLEVLKLLQNSYMGKVKMIYIDPPYNTGNDFVYHDDFHRNQKEEDEAAGVINEEGQRMVKNKESNGKFHSDWCSMVYARLMVARSLLTDDGAIFVSINDCEVDNLMKLCNDVFGESNLLVNSIWINGRTSSAHFTNSHEYVIGYAKNLNKLPFFKYKGDGENISDRTIKKPGTKNPLSDISFPAGIEFECEDKIFPKSFGKNEPVEIVEGTMICEGKKLKEPITIRAAWAMADMIKEWINGETVYDQKGQLVNRFFFKENGVLQYEKQKGTIHPNSVISNVSTKMGTNVVDSLLNSGIFPFPKPVDLVKYYMPMVDTYDIVLDFFSGSATTAHAVMELNAEDGGNRKFIMVQLPEETATDSEAYKAGYKNICEIGKERIRRAGKKIKEEHPDAKDLDVGFRVFKCDESNYKEVALAPKDYDQGQLELLVDNIKKGRGDLDLLFDCMLRWGVTLDLPMSKTEVDGCMIHNVNDGGLVACFDGKVTERVIEAIAEMYPAKVVFRDSSFEEAAQKMNLFEMFKQKCNWTDQEVRNNVKVI